MSHLRACVEIIGELSRVTRAVVVVVVVGARRRSSVRYQVRVTLVCRAKSTFLISDVKNVDNLMEEIDLDHWFTIPGVCDIILSPSYSISILLIILYVI